MEILRHIANKNITMKKTSLSGESSTNKDNTVSAH